MRPRRFFPILLVATATWLAAGPGGVTLQAIAACWHHPVSPGTHDGHHQPQTPDVPPGTPCFCDQMTGGSDFVVTSAAAAPVVALGILALPVREVPFPHLPSPIPGLSRAPLPPPPNALA